MRKFDHWQNAGQDVSHGWVSAADLKTRDGRTVLVIAAPVGNNIMLDMAGALALHAWLGELLEQESKAAGLEGSGVKG